MATGQTPTYLLPYPLSTDPVDVHGDIFELADRLEDVIGGLSSLPAQSGNSGKFLTTNGLSASWAVLPLSGYAPISAPSFTDSIELYGSDYIFLDLYGDNSDSYISSSTTDFEVGVYPDFGSAGADLYLDKDIFRTRTYNSQILLSDATGLQIKNDGGYYAKKFAIQGYYSGSEDLVVNGFKILANIPLTEKVTIATIPASTVNLDVTDNGSVSYYMSDTNTNWTINIRATAGYPFNDLLYPSESLTTVLIVTNGATAYYPTALQIDGVAQSVKWQGGTAPTAGNANAVDIYTFNIIKKDATPTYLVLGSQTKFA